AGCAAKQRGSAAVDGTAASPMPEALKGYVASGEVPCLVALAAREGDAQVAALGTDREAIFRVASMTKPVVAAATMMLVEEGNLPPAGPVAGLLPGLANRKVASRPDAPLEDTVPAKRSIVVRALLTFTFGTGIAFAPLPITRAMDELALGQGIPAPQKPPP